MNVMVKHLSSKQIKDLETEFGKLDNDGSGTLEIEELQRAIENAKMNISEAEIRQIIKEIDYAENGKINYSEFISATINTKDFLTEDRLQAIFQSFDIDNTKYITIQNLKDAFSKFGRSISQREIEQIMKEHDKDGDQQIDFNEFKEMMLGEKELAVATTIDQ